MGVRVTDIDRGYKKRVKTIRSMGRPSVTVGVHAAEGAGTYEDGRTTVLDVAVWNEFGTSKAPARSFLRAWYDGAKGEALRLQNALMRAVARGTLGRDDALNRLGLWAVGQIQDRMATSIPPPNAPSTVRRKGSSTTLIDTGQLRTSITHQVHDESR